MRGGNGEGRGMKAGEGRFTDCRSVPVTNDNGAVGNDTKSSGVPGPVESNHVT